MHAVAIHALRTARRPISRRACRIVAGVRHPIYSRPFHRSPISRRTPEETAGQGNGHTENPSIESSKASNGNAEQDGTEASRITQGEASTLTPKPRNGNGKPTSGRLKGNRPRQTEGLPPVQLPEWFWKKNVKCLEDLTQSGTLAVYGITGVNGEVDGDDNSVAAEVARMALALGDCDLTSTKDAKYSMHVDVYKEILSSLRAGLSLRPPKNSENLNINRPITLLQFVETIATKLGADLIRLDAQDIAQIVGPYVDENVAWTSSKTALLGYDAQRVAGKLETYDMDPAEEDAALDEGDQQKFPNWFKMMNSVLPKNKNHTRQYKQSPANLDLKFERVGILDFGQNPQSAPASTSESDQWNNLKFNAILSELLAAADVKRAASPSKSDCTEPVESKPASSGTIIQVRDYKALTGTQQGADLLQRLRTAINKRWKDGKNIICVGTYSSEEGEAALSKPDIQHLQSDVVEGEKSTIFVPPDRRTEQDVVFETDEKARVRNMNIRHVEDMVLKLADGTQHLTPVIDLEKGLDSTAVDSAGLEDAVWPYARVRRLAITILGGSESPTIDGTVFSEALRLLSSSDEAKFSWGAAELKEEDDDVDTFLDEVSEASKGGLTKEKLKQIKKNCNSHEQKLLSGVVLPADIPPKETVEALKTLTSLSLVRPEAFSYGVLATDKIPGLLLYGPPGTGKTLLAKAVAKESGATMLEISGADVNDMFVGEGEKNVKAVFSLAKKLSPCVVFVDEADAIFSARGETRRPAHRELINQFLREWDGMNDLSAFIMVATNRPFDLDEAVLRRLPRRLLVDLPVEKDREAILKIHLKEELLDESVSLSELAKDTPFYSGSDLKNISVAAALACIREENEAATKHTGDEPYKYPEKRILTKQHFTKAIEEISASISEDMSTLSAIRKFDEKYGDRKGRRKKTSAMGFGGTTFVEKDSEAARVRKMEV
ncbi:ATPase family AAA domain-containing protein [Lachnellula subtilissima]|uniref:ATPase family AAA domain-containing protein n=1 Tax=Lachnellula subtilissima TaxID=602034 RepID=A0A8H8S0Q3_9HELO|nr:ATPase family AAA domain-containing protein [Lachnellula subtilissima]